eukprot:SAG22_NODE_759_length_7426_cov_15.767572_5_plen_236_part_00
MAAVAGPAGGQKAQTTKRKALKLRGMMTETTELLPHLFVGGWKACAEDRANLRARGITHVINATVDKPNKFEVVGLAAAAAAAGPGPGGGGDPAPAALAYLRVVLADVDEADIRQHLEPAAAFIEQCRSSGGRCLVHCVAGMSRSVSLCLGYLMLHSGMSLAAAFRHVKQRRTIVCPNPGFVAQLATLEVELQRQQRQQPQQPQGPSIDVAKYRENRFNKLDHYVVEAYKETVNQ